ncbi:hypothetical protein [Rhodoferax mekongensis]|uniref:hypothetical protein n=1 Tax=Rhodoferax mekongensis TaxID=3068341 RepID=UPI0028BF1D24|nr:hypothetical protein [Rhodoferax sp. TBRC 17199]MDT7517139.1 hypothetical protein [Rhodoferax sp. TBRC 17199]
MNIKIIALLVLLFGLSSIYANNENFSEVDIDGFGTHILRSKNNSDGITVFFQVDAPREIISNAPIGNKNILSKMVLRIGAATLNIQEACRGRNLDVLYARLQVRRSKVGDVWIQGGDGSEYYKVKISFAGDSTKKIKCEYLDEEPFTMVKNTHK